jgi:hypothetical protein
MSYRHDGAYIFLEFISKLIKRTCHSREVVMLRRRRSGLDLPSQHILVQTTKRIGMTLGCRVVVRPPYAWIVVEARSLNKSFSGQSR